MRPDIIRKAAGEFGISIESAIKMRIRYLLHLSDQWPKYIEHGGEVPDMGIWEIYDEMLALKKYEKRCRYPPRADAINDEMIQAAMDAPIESVVEFIRGKATAWCHDDRIPSLAWHKAKNRATCFPCGKSFNTINVLMDRDNYSFVDAVKFLAG